MNTPTIEKRLKSLETTITAYTGKRGISPLALSKLSDEELKKSLFTLISQVDPETPELLELLSAHPWVEAEYAAFKEKQQQEELTNVCK